MVIAKSVTRFQDFTNYHLEKCLRETETVFLFSIIFHFDSNSVPNFKRYLNSLRLRQADNIKYVVSKPTLGATS